MDIVLNKFRVESRKILDWFLTNYLNPYAGKRYLIDLFKYQIHIEIHIDITPPSCVKRQVKKYIYLLGFKNS